jgi:hypothetical protein
VKESFHRLLGFDPDQGEVLCWTEDGRAAGLGIGDLLVFGFDPVPEGTDFVFSALFVPFLHRALAHLESERGRVLNVNVGEAVDLPVEDIGSYRLVREGGSAITLKATLRGRKPSLTLSGIDKPGVYTLFKGERRVARIAAGLDPAESDPTPMSEGEREEFLGGAPAFSSVDSFLGELGPQASLKIPLFWTALAFLILEMALLRWRSLRRKRLAIRVNAES